MATPTTFDVQAVKKAMADDPKLDYIAAARQVR